MKFFRTILVVIVAVLGFTSCSDNFGFDEKNDIIGIWYGTNSYYNPVSGTKFRYLTIEFNENQTGKMEFEGPTSYKYAFFTWSVSNDIINCNGASANIDGDVDTSFSLSLRIEGNRLIPQNLYSYFILTRDNSVETNSGSGEEVVDNSELLKRVWISTSGDVVLNLKSDDTFEEYVLDAPYSKNYISVNKGNYSYDPRYERIYISSTWFDIITLTENSLMIRNESKTLSYNAGYTSDIPSQPNLHELLVEYWGWSSDNSKYQFLFSNDGITYYEKSNVNVGSYGKATLTARGTYVISGNKLICTFTSVTWPGGSASQYANIFPGWTYNKSCKKTFTIQSNGGKSVLVIDENGNRYTISPV